MRHTPPTSTPVVRVRSSQNHMATTFHLTVSVPETVQTAALTVLSECHREIERLENELTEYRPTSPIFQVNHATPHTPIPVTEDGMALLALSEQLRIETEDAFHMGAKGTLSPNPPFRWNPHSREVERLSDQAWLGFGAIGKGFALDRVRTLLEQHGFFHYCLNAGGSSILLSGCAGPDEPWSWGWSWSRNAEGVPLGLEFQHHSARPIAIGVSGTQEKGQHLVHTISTPEMPLTTALVASDSAATADALSTALYSAGWEAFFKLPRIQHRELKVAAVDSEGIPRWNDLFERCWGPVASWVFACTLLMSNWAATLLAETEEAVDLGDVAQATNPYLVERDPMWALLPLAALLLVLLHLKRPPKLQIKPIRMEKEHETPGE